MSDLRAVPDEPADSMSAQASRLVSAAFVARAAALARAGHFDAAEPILNEAIQERPTVDALDLLARIRAQQGRFAEAEELWRDALNRDAGFEGAHAGLRRIHVLQKRGRVVWWPIGLAMAVALAALFWSAAAKPPLSKPAAVPPAARAAALPPQSKAAALPPHSKMELGPVPGVNVRHENGDLVATFDAGLFSHGITLTDDARALLARLGPEIARNAASSHVIIEGHCDRAPIRGRTAYRDDFGLGLARAGVVFRFLRNTTGLPEDAFSLRSRGNDAPPFAESGRSGETRNRTVVIRIRPRG